MSKILVLAKNGKKTIDCTSILYTPEKFLPIFDLLKIGEKKAVFKETRARFALTLRYYDWDDVKEL